MEELLEIRQLLELGRVEDTLLLAIELEEMGKKGINRTILSYAKVLLLHLIKQQVEQRSTKSWDVSIRNSIAEINDVNSRPKGSQFGEKKIAEPMLYDHASQTHYAYSSTLTDPQNKALRFSKPCLGKGEYLDDEELEYCLESAFKSAL